MTTTQNILEFEVGQHYVTKVLEDSELGSFSANSTQLYQERQVAYLGLVTTLVTSLLQRKLAEDHYTVYFYSPASPWQHLKGSLPEWFRRRYPVKNKSHKRTVKFTRYATYPMADVVVPQNMGKLVIRDQVDAQS